jgi:hypothetical protein
MLFHLFEYPVNRIQKDKRCSWMLIGTASPNGRTGMCRPAASQNSNVGLGNESNALIKNNKFFFTVPARRLTTDD